MESYDIFMIVIGVSACSIAIGFAIWGGEKWTSNNLEGTSFSDNNYKLICKNYLTWQRSYMVWLIISYSATAVAVLSSLICIYIASSYAITAYKDIILYSIVSVFFTLAPMIVRPADKARAFRVAVDKIKSALLMYDQGAIKSEELVSSVISCENEISRGMIL
ncbi:MAG: hypothetical protein AAGU14_04540 [Eubacteriaceae bacterium]